MVGTADRAVECVLLLERRLVDRRLQLRQPRVEEDEGSIRRPCKVEAAV